MWRSLSLALVAPGLTSAQTATILLVVGIALAAGTAVLTVRGWGRPPRAAVLGGIGFGAIPYLIGQATGVLTPAMIVIPPLMLLLLDELLVGRRRPALLVGAVLGGLVALPVQHSGPVLVALGASAGIGLVVVAVLRPRGGSAVSGRLLTVVMSAAVVYVLALAYPLHLEQTGPRSFNAQVTDNQAGGATLLNGLLNSASHLVSSGSALSYLVLGLIAAGIVEVARRSKAH
ncbi:MAG: hypothetical protein NVSMB29_04890 [Candidatus Dormibacteria bacterium]